MSATPKILIGKPTDFTANQCDCACSHAPAELLSLTHERNDTLWQITPYLYEEALTDDHSLVFNPLATANVLVLNEVAIAILHSFTDSKSMNGGEVVHTQAITDLLQQFILFNLIQPINNQSTPTVYETDTLDVWLQITNACNLHCNYCYIEKTGASMSANTGHAAIEAAFRSATHTGFRAIRLKYAGGEATLNFSLVKLLHRHALDLASRSSLNLGEVLLTNGTLLTQDMIEYLRDECIRVMISLDGIDAVHNAHRAYSSGHGSFDAVMRSIDCAVACGLRPNLSITVTPESVDGLPGIVAFALDRDLNFNLNFVRVLNENNRECTDNTRIIAGVKAAFSVIESHLPQRRLIDYLLDRSVFNQPHEFTCGAGSTYLVVNPQGGVVRCQMEMDQVVTHISATDPLQALRADKRSTPNVAVSSIPVCRECCWRYWCAGGCHLLTLCNKGSITTRSPYCDVNKALYPGLLRLEGLRLLKWGNPVA